YITRKLGAKECGQILIPSNAVKNGIEYVNYVLIHEFVHAFQDMSWLSAEYKKDREHNGGRSDKKEDLSYLFNSNLISEGMAVYVQVDLSEKDSKTELLAKRRRVRTMANTLRWVESCGKDLPRYAVKYCRHVEAKYPELITSKASHYDKGFSLYYVFAKKNGQDIVKRVLDGDVSLIG
ncbi:MAG: hypothetical protein DRP29_10555, partial [Thermodesulfobacteriota bacterium]